jgi:hypothetical protein
VQDKLLTPLAARDKARSSYSRAMPPAAYRVRVIDRSPIADGKGGAFVGLAVDARFGRGKGEWFENDITGCVYAETGEVYVRYGRAYRAAGVLLGKKTPPAPEHVCKAAGVSAS